MGVCLWAVVLVIFVRYRCQSANSPTYLPTTYVLVAWLLGWSSCSSQAAKLRSQSMYRY